MWELQADLFPTKFLPESGFDPVLFTRLPYISGGDSFNEFIILDDVVVFARKKSSHLIYKEEV